MSTTLKARFSKNNRHKLKVHPIIYDDLIDIPVHNWEQIVQYGKVQFIIVLEHLRNSELNEILVRDAYDKMTDQYFEKRGIDLRDEELFILIQKRIEFRNKFMQGDKSAMNFIKLYTRQITDIKKNAVKPNLAQTRLAVQKWYGPIDKYKMTMSDFLDIVLLMEKEFATIESNKKQKNGEDN